MGQGTWDNYAWQLSCLSPTLLLVILKLIAVQIVSVGNTAKLVFRSVMAGTGPDSLLPLLPNSRSLASIHNDYSRGDTFQCVSKLYGNEELMIQVYRGKYLSKIL